MTNKTKNSAMSDQGSAQQEITRCLIVDDEQLARELIETHLKQITGYEVVASCASALQASDILKQEHVDLMFLDIEMPMLKGTEFYRNLVNKPSVIFTTAYRDYAVDGFELDAVDYLLKPIVFSRFFQAIERFDANRRVSKNVAPSAKLAGDSEHVGDDFEPQSDHVFVRKDRKQVKIILDDILYIQSLKDYIKIVTVSGSHIVKYTIGQFNDQLSSEFVRVHRSYIANLSKVTAYTSHDIEIDEHEIPIGENFRLNFEAAITKCS